MRVHIVGAGAIGGLTGAFLAQAGADVHFVDVDREHIDAINADGLRVDGLDGEVVIRATASTADALDEPLDLVLVAVKSQHTALALASIRHRLHDTTLVVSLQNGLNLDMVAELVGASNTAGVMLNLSADYIAPGHIRYGGAGDYFLGMVDGAADPRLASLAHLLQARSRVVLTDNIHGYLWSKECYGCLLVATALGDDPIHEVVSVSYKRDIVSAALEEAVRIADAAGVVLEPYFPFDPVAFRRPGSAVRRQAFYERVVDRYRHQIKQRSGIWRDLRVRRRTSEVPWLTGELVRRGDALGIDSPINRRIVGMIAEIEAGTRDISEQNFLELETLLRGISGAGTTDV